MSQPAPLVERVRAALDDQAWREVPMFGGRSFMVDDRMVVAVLKDDALLVRVDPARSDELLSQPGAQPAEMGAGRAMGPSWIQVAADAIAGDDELSFWTEVALAYHAQVASGSA